MKLNDIILTASSNIWRSKLRTILTIIAIFIGALTITLTNGIGQGVSSYIDKQLGNLGAEDALIIEPDQQVLDLGGPQEYDPDEAILSGVGGFSLPVLTQKDVEAITDTEGILSADPLLSSSPEYIGFGEKKFKTSISPFIAGTRLDLAAGESISEASTEPHIVLPIDYVEPLGFTSADNAVGKKVIFGIKDPIGSIQEVSATIVGVQQKSLMGLGGITVNNSLVFDLREIQTKGLPAATKDQFIVVVARFNQDASESEIQAIKDDLKEKGYRARTIEDSIGVVKQVIDAIVLVLSLFAVIALVAASFGIINTLLMAVQERTREIGLMKAMGMGSAQVFMLFSAEAAFLGFWGSILGIIVANILGVIINQFASENFLKDLPGFELVTFSWESMLGIVLVIMGIAFLAGTLPASRAAKQNPIDSLRYE